MPKSTDKIITKVKTLVKKLKEAGFHLRAIYLYGSYADGKHKKNSDIDLAIISPDFRLDTMHDWTKVFRICLEVDSRIEPILYRPQDLKTPHPLAYRIKKYGRILYRA